MKIYFWCVGKAHEPYIKEGVEIFTKRIAHYYPVEWRIFAPSKILLKEQVIKNEAIQLLDAIKPDKILIALDENGQQWNSVELAGFIQQRADERSKDLIFLIGGAYGLHEIILNRCNYKWSLSNLTLPHQLVRLILSEQVYRACTISRNEKYHHS